MQLKVLLEVMQIKVLVKVFGSDLSPIKVYHTDVCFHHTDGVAFGDKDGGKIAKYKPEIGFKWIGTELKETIIHEVDMPKAEFWRKAQGLMEEWDKKDYHLRNNNCNHFSDAVLKAFGHGGLPGVYFSRGDHADKMLYNTLAQFVYVSPGATEGIAKFATRTRDNVGGFIGAKLNPFKW